MNAHSIFEYVKFLENRIKELEYEDSDSSYSGSKSDEESVNSYDINDYIATNLELVAQSHENPHKRAAYMNAAESIRKYPHTITNGKMVAEGPNKINGIGKNIAKKIDLLISKW